MAGLKITEEKRGRVLIYHINTAIDESVSDTLREIIETRLHEGNSRVIINMRGVDFICTEGIGILLRLTKEAEKYRGKLILVDLPGPIYTIIDDIGLVELLNIRDTIEEALRELA